MKKNLKRIVSLLVVLMMLFNMAFVTSAARSLDADVKWTADFEGDSWADVMGASVFSQADFEPGSEVIRYFKISNPGKLAFSYDFKFTAASDMGSLADVIDVYYLGDVTANKTVTEMTKIGTLNEVVNGNSIVSGKMLPSDLTGDGFEIGEKNIAVALKMQDGVSSEYMDKTLGDGFYISLVTEECDFEYPATEKFQIKFPEADFLYRVGNMNTVALSSLFKAIDGEEINNVTIAIEAINSNVSGVYTANSSDWTKGTIKFSGTGPVKVTISADDAKPVELIVEVIDAKNITKAESATANDVVLLNNISGTFVVSNGHTFHGNGFEVSLPTTSVKNVGNGFTGYISVGATQDDGIANGGNLDNVKIIGPVYPEMFIYRDQAKITDKSDPDYGDGYNMRYFVNSVIVYGGNCRISNSYISGSRTALCLRGGNNVIVENTTLSGGAYANMQICAGSKVTLKDLTTIQVDVSDSYGKGVNAHGLGIAVDSNVVDLYIEGTLNQYNWLCQSQWNSIVPSTYQSQFPKFFTNNSFSKYWHYYNGGTAPYVNIGMIFACNWDTSKIHDNRSVVNYSATDATIAGVSGGVYTKTNTVDNVVTDSQLTGPVYKSEKFNPVAPTLNFNIEQDTDDENDDADTYCVYEEAKGTLSLGIASSSKTIDLSNVKVLKNGTEIAYTKYLNGTEITGDTVTISESNGAKQTLTFKAKSSDCGYDKNGNAIPGMIEYEWTVTVEVATLSFPAPEWNMGGLYTFDAKTYGVYAYYSTSQGYGEAVQIYEGIKVNYYDKNGTLKKLDLSGTQSIPTGSNNSNANAFTYTLADGSTLTMKYSSGFKSGATTHQFTTYKGKTYIYPQSLDNDNYVRAKTTNQDFDVKLTYTFTDPNGQSITQVMQWYNAKGSNGSVKTEQWKTFDSVNGKNSCVTGDTLVTLSDGSQKRIDEVTYDDQLLVWDFVDGEYEVMPPAILYNHGYDNYSVTTLNFSDGSDVNVIGDHGFFDASANEFVMLNEDNVAVYVGKEFLKHNGMSFEPVTLEGYSVKEEYTGSYSILTTVHYNCILGNMFTLSPNVIGGNYFMPFEVGEGLKFDAEKRQADIEKYGLFTYEELADYITEEQFYALNAPYVKVAVGKGIITMEELMQIIDELIPKTESSDIPVVTDDPGIAVISEEDDVTVIAESQDVITAETITSGLNTISTAKAEFIITAENASKTESGYMMDAEEAKLSLTLSGSSKGYAVITVDGDEYYTASIENGATKDIIIKNAKGEEITIASYWGTHENTAVDVIDLGEFFVKSLSATEIGAEAVIENTTKYDVENVNVYIAVYNTTTKQLVAVKAEKVTVKGGEEYSIAVTADIPEDYEIKAFVWDDGMKPIIK